MSQSKRTVLITGCSSGIGEDATKFLASKGWTVFAGVRKEEDAEKLRRHDANIKPVILDVTKADHITRAVEEVRAAVGSDGLDALVNNSGVAYSGPLEFTDYDDMVKQFEVNVFGVIRLTRAVMPLIRMGRPGRIVNLGSSASDQNLPLLGLYGGTKAAMVTITEAFRREVARWGIKVVLIKPGPVQTNFQETAMKTQEEFSRKYPEGSDCRKFYGGDMQKMSESVKVFEKHNVPPSYVTARIYTALTAKNPKNVYYDTWGTYFTVMMIHWLPLGMQDSMVDKMFLTKP